MSTDHDLAKREVMLAGAAPADLLAALEVIERQRLLLDAQARNAAWSEGRKGDGIIKVPGLSHTQTSLLRRFAACGVVRYADADDLHRHVSALRRALKTLAPGVQITTLVGEGYEIVSGFDEVYRLLHGGRTPSLSIPGFTPKQTRILAHLAARGAAHCDQFACLQRHMSNIRAAIKRAGYAKRITIETHAGEGLYTITKGKDFLAKLVAGEADDIIPTRAIGLVSIAA